MHRAAAIYKHADLPARRVRDAYQPSCELGSREPIERDLVPVDPLQRLGLRRAESARVAVDLQCCLSSPNRHVRFDNAKASADVAAADAAGKSAVRLDEIGSDQPEVRVFFPGA